MVTFLPTPIGNLQDITLHTLEALKQCDVLLCEDTRVSKKLVTLLVERGLLPHKDYIYYPFHTHNQERFLAQGAVEFFSQNIGFLSDAGMPCISDPGVELVRYLQTNNIPFEVLGGISAVTLMVAFSGIIEKEFSFLGFPPHKLKEKTEFFSLVFKSPYPIILYESPHRLFESLELMTQVDKNRQVFLAKELTKKYQSTFKGSLEEVLKTLRSSNNEALLKGEWAMVVDKAKCTENYTLSEEALLALEIPPKIKAKILAKMKGGSVSDYYQSLIK
ncbi:16S rRNA (cytidine(1402)-2'-O)-methyltransferase [Helicobacter turcicus]|uniref:16S rRNA (Cytidine(1402)-2'-O)-methyltransferase n=1 Tax=Helicobacter turcicus TaxID=2867412 RepID=A0ABS7JMW3_9HELI|nr:16S rRNA (cytidine(1402)-2'-O)-methyltransferase [Helicobacter turcicus]MBX7490710.1 16S rRNA (cytidine(1402)-2'-O)-methyltransferase [Helicobacter turcicus]MBX7545681.1 16S rRNA (cytidine(1402)-2'-O)-methyltransferase [Helicobacter turcicus]